MPRSALPLALKQCIFICTKHGACRHMYMFLTVCRSCQVVASVTASICRVLSEHGSMNTHSQAQTKLQQPVAERAQVQHIVLVHPPAAAATIAPLHSVCTAARWDMTSFHEDMALLNTGSSLLEEDPDQQGERRIQNGSNIGSCPPLCTRRPPACLLLRQQALGQPQPPPLAVRSSCHPAHSHS